MTTPFAYIASYDTDDNETVHVRDTYWSPKLDEAWELLCGTLKSGTYLRGWYADDYQTKMLKWTFLHNGGK